MITALFTWPYFKATRHPLPCLLVLIPLLGAYEGGVLWLGGNQADALRNGADSWLRWGLEAFGLRQMIVAPALVLLGFGAWSWRRRSERPDDPLGTCFGMGLECFLFALGLWGVSHALKPILDWAGVQLAAGPPVDPVIGRVVTYMGAGIYEEVLFRLVLFGGLSTLLKLAMVGRKTSVLLAATVSSLLFAAAHHIGPNGERMDSFVFLFRTVAGFYFAMLFQFRGFGVAAGAHAAYDVLVGLT